MGKSGLSDSRRRSWPQGGVWIHIALVMGGKADPFRSSYTGLHLGPAQT